MREYLKINIHLSFLVGMMGMIFSSLVIAKPIAKPAAAPTKKTFLLINSNAQGATIAIDGILAGNVGTPIEVDAGTIEIEISAKGFASKKARLKILANRQNRFDINLSKPAPPKPKPVVATSAKKQKAGNSGVPLPDPRTEKLFDDRAVQAGKNDPSLASRNLQSEFALDGAAAAQPPPQQVYPQQQPMPSGAYSYAPPPQSYGYNPYAPGYYPPPQPMYPQPAPYGYPTTPYGPPAYSPPPQPYVAAPPPAPTYNYPAPSSVEATPLPDVSDSGDSEPPREDFLGPGDRSKRSSKKSRPRPVQHLRSQKKSAPSKPDRSTDLMVSLLPFGVGQAYHEEYLLGTAFAGAEVGALYWWYLNKTQEDQAIANAETYFADSSHTDAEKQEFSQETETYVAEKRNQQMIGLGCFGGLWLLGTIESMMWEPKQPPANTKKNSHRRRLTQLETIKDSKVYLPLTLAGPDQQDSMEPRFDLGLWAPRSNDSKIGLLVSVDWQW